MSEYWKSIPKLYCKYCQVWYADNKASTEAHNRSLKHQGNVRRKMTQLQKESTAKAKEQIALNAELAKIEAAALKAFEKDVAKNPEVAKEYLSTPSIYSKRGHPEEKERKSESQQNNYFEKAMNTAQASTSRHQSVLSYKYESPNAWVPVKTAKEKVPDLSLPKSDNVRLQPEDVVKNVYEDNTEVLKFEEKKVGKLGKSAIPTTFKKRRLTHDNMRSRNSED